MKVIYESTDADGQTLLVWRGQRNTLNFLISHISGGRTWNMTREQAEDFTRALNSEDHHDHEH